MKTLKYTVLGKFSDCTSVISYMCFEDEHGERTLEYNDAGSYIKYNEHKIYSMYVLPWLNGADCIPSEYLANKNYKILCPHCNNEFVLEKQLEDDDFVNCKRCYKTTLNTYKITELAYKECLFFEIAHDVEEQMIYNYCKDIESLDIPKKYIEKVKKYLKSNTIENYNPRMLYVN